MGAIHLFEFRCSKREFLERLKRKAAFRELLGALPEANGFFVFSYRIRPRDFAYADHSLPDNPRKPASF